MTVSEKTKEETGARCTKVQSSRRELWANVSLSHPVFGSLLRQSLFLCQSSHFTCFFFWFFLASRVSERDKKLDDLRAHSGSEPCARVNSSSSPHPSPSSLSPPYSLCSQHLLGRSLGEAVGGWTNRKHSSPIMTRGESYYMIRVAFFPEGA